MTISYRVNSSLQRINRLHCSTAERYFAEPQYQALSMRMSKTAQTRVCNPDYPAESLKIEQGRPESQFGGKLCMSWHRILPMSWAWNWSADDALCNP
jgi:hypothetical protein